MGYIIIIVGICVFLFIRRIIIDRMPINFDKPRTKKELEEQLRNAHIQHYKIVQENSELRQQLEEKTETVDTTKIEQYEELKTRFDNLLKMFNADATPISGQDKELLQAVKETLILYDTTDNPMPAQHILNLLRVRMYNIAKESMEPNSEERKRIEKIIEDFKKVMREKGFRC
jgi:hypothetical protein